MSVYFFTVVDIRFCCASFVRGLARAPQLHAVSISNFEGKP